MEDVGGAVNEALDEDYIMDAPIITGEKRSFTEMAIPVEGFPSETEMADNVENEMISRVYPKADLPYAHGDWVPPTAYPTYISRGRFRPF